MSQTKCCAWERDASLFQPRPRSSSLFESDLCLAIVFWITDMPKNRARVPLPPKLVSAPSFSPRETIVPESGLCGRTICQGADCTWPSKPRKRAAFRRARARPSRPGAKAPTLYRRVFCFVFLDARRKGRVLSLLLRPLAFFLSIFRFSFWGKPRKKGKKTF